MSGLPKQVEEARTQLDEMKKQFSGDDDAKEADTAQATGEQDVDTGQAHEVQSPQTENWEARFNTLRGKYDAEVPRLHEHIRQLTDRLHVLESQQAKVADAQQAQPESSVNRQALEEYDEEFGKLVDVIDTLKNELAVTKRELANVQGNVQQVGQSQRLSREQQFWRELEALVPDHRTINGLPEFDAWLEQPDGFSKTTRKQNGNAALAALDVQTVAAIYNEFKSQHKQTSQRPQNIAPVTRQSSQSVQTDRREGDYFTDAEVNDLYAKRMRGTYPFSWRNQTVKNEDEAKLLAFEIQRAGFEGRIYG